MVASDGDDHGVRIPRPPGGDQRLPRRQIRAGAGADHVQRLAEERRHGDRTPQDRPAPQPLAAVDLDQRT
jgi:hypothetical protein